MNAVLLSMNATRNQSAVDADTPNAADIAGSAMFSELALTITSIRRRHAEHAPAAPADLALVGAAAGPGIGGTGRRSVPLALARADLLPLRRR
jgi:hypothetical protein